MNDPNKRIDVNLSSLLSLKAELLRKQEEVNRFKKPDTTDPFSFIPKRSSNSSGRSHEKKKKNDVPPKANADKSETDKRADEDYEMLAKSKRILEAKAKLYDRMTNSGGLLNSDDTCLVRFNQKKQDDRHPTESSSSDSESDAEDNRGDSDHDDDDKWTEYTDCLGRTRKCLKEDLEFFKKKDLDLVDAAKSRTAHSEGREGLEEKEVKTPWFVDTKGISSADLPLYTPTSDDDTMSMISKSSKMEEMRSQWEQKEQENLNRDKIHYQDVLFDEARTHGVGYYAFSVDAVEREKQQKVLEKERDKTLEEQRKREQLRLSRERIVAERVFGAKNRQRARLGLAPLSREEYEAAEKKEKGVVEEIKDDGKEKKREEKEKKKREKEEKERDEKRQQHLRPWDQGKDNAPRKATVSSDEEDWKYKPEKPEPMSQNQWNELKRTERNPDFAPPSMDTFNRFTTKKPKPLKRRNETSYANMYSEPIRNELDGNDFPVDQDEDNSTKRTRAEIPPPPTFDYYGPSSSSKPKPKGKNEDITASIEAGLKFLREQSDKIAPGTKQSWVSNTTYEE